MQLLLDKNAGESTGSATAINLTSNTGATISFTGGLALTTTSGRPANFSDGGEIAVRAIVATAARRFGG